MTRRVLIVSYYFPPLGLAGVTRPVQLFSRLAHYGYECDLLTVKPVAYFAYEPELLIGLDQTRIHRAGSYDPQRIMYVCGIRTLPATSHAASAQIATSIFPDSKRGWIGPAVRLGTKLVRRRGIDIVLSTSPPISAHVVARRIVAKTDTKWVADFRDLWTTMPIEDSYRSGERIERGKRLLTEIQKSATTITAVNRSVADYVGAKTVITNGYDPENAHQWSSQPELRGFVIGLLGTFNELLPVEPLLKCLMKVREKSPAAFARIRLLQVGRVDRAWLPAQLKAYGLDESCEIMGLQSRTRSVELLNAASMFYLGVKRGWGDRITTARIYDLLASGRPILAYAEKMSEISTVLSAAPNSMTFTEDTLGNASEYVADLIERQSKMQLMLNPIPGYADAYSWENIAAQFAALFDRIV